MFFLNLFYWKIHQNYWFKLQHIFDISKRMYTQTFRPRDNVPVTTSPRRLWPAERGGPLTSRGHAPQYKTIIIIIAFIYAVLFYTELQSALQIKRKKAKQPNKNKCLRTIVWQVLFFLFLLLWNKKYHKWKVYQAKHKK